MMPPKKQWHPFKTKSDHNQNYYLFSFFFLLYKHTSFTIYWCTRQNENVEVGWSKCVGSTLLHMVRLFKTVVASNIVPWTNAFASLSSYGTILVVFTARAARERSLGISFVLTFSRTYFQQLGATHKIFNVWSSGSSFCSEESLVVSWRPAAVVVVVGLLVFFWVCWYVTTWFGTLDVAPYCASPRSILPRIGVVCCCCY